MARPCLLWPALQVKNYVSTGREPHFMSSSVLHFIAISLQKGNSSSPRWRITLFVVVVVLKSHVSVEVFLTNHIPDLLLLFPSVKSLFLCKIPTVKQRKFFHETFFLFFFAVSKLIHIFAAIQLAPKGLWVTFLLEKDVTNVIFYYQISQIWPS